jgi:hypothetical protein
MRKEGDDGRENSSPKTVQETVFGSTEQSVEVTGLGMIAALIISSWFLVSDGTLELANYILFAVFLVASAGVLVWRIVRRAFHSRSSSLKHD